MPSNDKKKPLTDEQLKYISYYEQISVLTSKYVKGFKNTAQNLPLWKDYAAAMKDHPKKLKEFYEAEVTTEDSTPPQPPPPPPGPR